MSLYEIFTDRIFYKNIAENLDLDILKKEVYDYIENHDPNGRNISNVGGYQSRDFDWDIISPEDTEYIQLRTLFELIYENLNIMIEGCGNQLVITNAWASINYKNNYNSLHQHPWSVFSGVFYLNNPKDSKGDLRLHRSREFVDYRLDEFMDKNDDPKYWGASYNISPNNGDLIMFPSSMLHDVLPNQSDTPRISIAFNTSPNQNIDQSRDI